MPTNLTIDNLSPHLFWDVDKSKLDVEKNKRLIIHRALEYGLMSDWNWIKEVYGIKEIGVVAKTLRDLDKKSASFISKIAKIPIEEFRCYSTNPSTPEHWNF